MSSVLRSIWSRMRAGVVVSGPSNGYPSSTASSDGWAVFGARASGVSPSPGTARIATSTSGLNSTTWAGSCRLLEAAPTSTVSSLVPATTCALVATRFGATTKPDPSSARMHCGALPWILSTLFDAVRTAGAPASVMFGGATSALTLPGWRDPGVRPEELSMARRSSGNWLADGTAAPTTASIPPSSAEPRTPSVSPGKLAEASGSATSHAASTTVNACSRAPSADSICTGRPPVIRSLISRPRNTPLASPSATSTTTTPMLTITRTIGVSRPPATVGAAITPSNAPSSTPRNDSRETARPWRHPEMPASTASRSTNRSTQVMVVFLVSPARCRTGSPSQQATIAIFAAGHRIRASSEPVIVLPIDVQAPYRAGLAWPGHPGLAQRGPQRPAPGGHRDRRHHLHVGRPVRRGQAAAGPIQLGGGQLGALAQRDRHHQRLNGILPLGHRVRDGQVHRRDGLHGAPGGGRHRHPVWGVDQRGHLLDQPELAVFVAAEQVPGGLPGVVRFEHPAQWAAGQRVHRVDPGEQQADLAGRALPDQPVGPQLEAGNVLVERGDPDLGGIRQGSSERADRIAGEVGQDGRALGGGVELQHPGVWEALDQPTPQVARHAGAKEHPDRVVMLVRIRRGQGDRAQRGPGVRDVGGSVAAHLGPEGVRVGRAGHREPGTAGDRAADAH